MANIGKCFICGELKPLIEFIVYKKKVMICSDCKKKVIHGLKITDKILNEVILETILEIRKIVLKKLGKDDYYIDSRIKFERLLCSIGNGGAVKNKSHCMVCGIDNGVKIVVPTFVAMFVSDKEMFGLPLCSSCKKMVTHVTMSL